MSYVVHIDRFSHHCFLAVGELFTWTCDIERAWFFSSYAEAHHHTASNPLVFAHLKPEVFTLEDMFVINIVRRGGRLFKTLSDHTWSPMLDEARIFYTRSGAKSALDRDTSFQGESVVSSLGEILIAKIIEG